MSLFIGVDIGTSSSKGVLVNGSGEVLSQAIRSHVVSRPHPGWVEMDAHIWWKECVAILAELVAAAPGQVDAVGVSGMGPCVLVTDEHMTPLRPAILYGVDTRATAQIDALDAELGGAEVLARCGSVLPRLWAPSSPGSPSRSLRCSPAPADSSCPAAGWRTA